MFFSKLILPVIAVFSVATAVFATPLALPNTELVKRTASTDALSELQSFQSTVESLVSGFSANPTTTLNSLNSAFTTSTKSFKSKGANIIVAADVDVFLSVAVAVVLKLVVSLNVFAFIDIVVNAKVDVFLSAWINALDVVSVGVAAKIGAAIPLADVQIFGTLQLFLSAKLLVIIDILGIIIL